MSHRAATLTAYDRYAANGRRLIDAAGLSRADLVAGHGRRIIGQLARLDADVVDDIAWLLRHAHGRIDA